MNCRLAKIPIFKCLKLSSHSNQSLFFEICLLRTILIQILRLGHFRPTFGGAIAQCQGIMNLWSYRWKIIMQICHDDN